MKTRIIRYLIEWLFKRYPYLCVDVVVGPGKHIHRDPRKSRKQLAVVTGETAGV